ncbi:hypothetical protein [Jiella pelagia]|uniref:Uncharacterized protein n=1 Tax=Jiella pelagia TaxID=2986949 RepID=A0ABY7C3F9_9HYPH|nr:hypothetical protein [Jiella pelagia]WAP69574.1 hypothetical protein OH818_04870 [Jiella pelagia]
MAGKSDSAAIARFFDWVAGIADQPPRPNSRYLPLSDKAKAERAT